MEYIKEFLVLFVLITLLLYLVPGERLQKYVRFFTEIILTVGILVPFLSLFFDSEKFLTMIEYETFAENLSEISRDMERMEFVGNADYLTEYETAIEEDVRQIAEPVAEGYGYRVGSVTVHLTEAYRVKDMTVSLENGEQNESIVVEEISWTEKKMETEAGQSEQGMTVELKRKLAEYYQMEEAQIAVQCSRMD